MSTKTNELWKTQFSEEQLELWGDYLAEDMIDYYHSIMIQDPKQAALSISCIEKIKEYYEISSDVS